MSILGYNPLQILDYLKDSVARMRDMAATDGGAFGTRLWSLADQLADDADKLEAELIAGGYLSSQASEP